MLVAVITEQHLDNVLPTIRRVQDQCDAFEWRLDYLTELDIEGLANARSQISHPLIFTLRPVDQGGRYGGDERERLRIIDQLGALQPDYIDLEHKVPDAFISRFHLQYTTVSIMRSYHNFNNTPNDLDGILQSMQHKHCAGYKLITTAQSTIDCLRMLQFVQRVSAMYRIVGHCMGEVGQPSRVIGKVVGNMFTYASISEHNAPAPGALSLQTLNDIYRIRRLTSATAVYGLLGDPIRQSVGHIFHNDNFVQQQIDAVYVKLQVTKSQLGDFFRLITGLPFKGFSVTMPLKNSLAPFVFQVEQQNLDPSNANVPDNTRIMLTNINSTVAVNTISIDNNKIIATNTDGLGALNALEHVATVNNKTHFDTRCRWVRTSHCVRGKKSQRKQYHHR